MNGAFTVAVEGAVLHGEARVPAQAREVSPLIFVHGMGGDRRDWDPLLAALPPDATIIRYDLRGFGESTADETIVYSHADDLLALLDALGLAHATLVALSMGGGIALNFALSHPERVDRLALVSPALVGWEWSDDWKAQWRHVADAARAGDMATARERWFDHPMFAAAREDDRLADILDAAIGRYHGRQWIRDAQRDELPDIERLHTLATPTLLLTGERDVPDLRLIADVIEGTAPSVTRIDHPEAGHLLHLERTAAVARAIGDFLDPAD